VLCFEVFSFGKDPFTAYRAQMKFVYFSAHGKEPLHQPLMDQLTEALDHHGVAEVPSVVAELLRGCVAREMAERLTFAQVVELTGRAAREGVPIKRGPRGGDNAVRVEANAGVGVGAGAGAGAGYSSCDAESQPTTDITAAGSGYSTCVGEYAAGDNLHGQAAAAASGYSQGFDDVGPASSSGYSQGFGDVSAASGSTTTSGYSQGLGVASNTGDAIVSIGELGARTEVLQRDSLEDGDGGYLGVQASVVETAFDGLREVGGAGAAVYHLSSGSKGSPTRPADAVYHLANRETKTSWMEEHLGATNRTEGGHIQASSVAGGADEGVADHDGGSADGVVAGVVVDDDQPEAKGISTGSSDTAIPRSITRRRKPSVYLGFEDEDDDEGTRL
jgi:hypothetical protein